VRILKVQRWIELFSTTWIPIPKSHTFRNLLKDEWFLRLVRSEDGEEYEPNKFQEVRAQAFKFVVLTSSPRPNEDMVPRLYALRVLVKG
jgi:hypothetical protein